MLPRSSEHSGRGSFVYLAAAQSLAHAFLLSLLSLTQRCSSVAVYRVLFRRSEVGGSVPYLRMQRVPYLLLKDFMGCLAWAGIEALVDWGFLVLLASSLHVVSDHLS